MKVRIFFLCLIILSFVSCNYSLKSKSDDRVQPGVLQDIPQSIIQSDNQFSIQLFQHICQLDQEKNIFISPLSVSFALGMTMNGTDGETFEEIKNTLNYSGSSLSEINQSYLTLIAHLAEVDDGVTISLANSIWYDQNVTLTETFKQLNTHYFNAQISGLDFQDTETALQTINSWVENQTNGKIEDLIQEIDPQAVMFLINAIYFQGDWKYSFNSEETSVENFWIEDSIAVHCDMMSTKSNFKYTRSKFYDAVELPYTNEDFSMVLVKPNKSSLADYIDAFTYSQLTDILGLMTADSVNLTMPKIELEYEKKLNSVLQDMGIKNAFDPNQADFSNLFNEIKQGMWIDKVKHKSYLKIDEEGTEAAAATSVQISYGSVSDEIYMDFNRPFLFFIMEKETGTILFAGSVYDPKNQG